MDSSAVLPEGTGYLEQRVENVESWEDEVENH
jgi:hypothetical protein